MEENQDNIEADNKAANLNSEVEEKSDIERILKYTALRLVTLFITVVIGIYLIILISNMGGALDNIRQAQIRENVGIQLQGMQRQLAEMSDEDRREYEQSLIEQEERRLGLDQPFAIRSLHYLRDAITLDLGRAEHMTSDAGSRQVRNIIIERLPPTLMLMLTSFLILFFISIFAALFLSRRYGSLLDKIVVTLAPSSAAPGWFYGIFLIMIFAATLQWLPFGGMVQAPPPDELHLYLLSLLRHLILPVASIIMGAIFIQIYQWRTFFLIYSSEDYVEMAKAKGLSGREIELKYILRPTLPPIVTAFLMSLIFQWMGSIILEIVFNWPGLGRMLFEAIGQFDIPVIVGGQVVYAYLLAISVFLLDISYAILDPRVKMGANGGDKK